MVGIVAVDSFKTIGQPPMPDAQIEKVLKPFRDDFIGHTREFVTSGFFTAESDPKFVQKVAVRHVARAAADRDRAPCSRC